VKCYHGPRKPQRILLAAWNQAVHSAAARQPADLGGVPGSRGGEEQGAHPHRGAGAQHVAQGVSRQAAGDGPGGKAGPADRDQGGDPPGSGRVSNQATKRTLPSLVSYREGSCV